MKKYLIAVLVVFGIAVGGVGTVYAKALPFDTSKCYNLNVFSCTDYAYEYCQYNGPENCYPLILHGRNDVAGHAISVIKKPFKDDPKSARFYVYEPQNKSDEPITYWDQSINKSKVISPGAMNDLIAKYGSVIGMTRAEILARPAEDQYHIMTGTRKYADYYKEAYGTDSPKAFWSDGWFPVNDLRAITDQMYGKYKPKQKIPSCAELSNRSCLLNAPQYSTKYPYQISSEQKNLQNAGRVCLDIDGFPATIACHDNVMKVVKRGTDLDPVKVAVNLDINTYCPLSEVSPDKNVTFTIDAPQMGPSSLAGFSLYNYTALLYVDNNFAQTKVWSPTDKTITFDTSKYRGKAATAAAHNVHVLFEVQNNNGDKILSAKSNTVPMNVGPKGCLLAEFISHHRVNGNICNTYTYNFVRSATPTMPNPTKADQWLTMPLGANCTYDSAKVINANLVSHQGFILQPGISNASGISETRQKIPATNGTYRLTETGITAIKHKKK
jgi:hypothetical protein